MKKNNDPLAHDYSIDTGIIMFLILFFSVIFLLFRNNFSNPELIAAQLIIYAAILFLFLLIFRILKNQKIKAVLKVIFVFGFFGSFYGFIADFQLIFFGWQDSKLIALDKLLFGSEFSLILERFISPYLTEAMMFAYVFYLPLLIIVAFIAFYSGSEKGLGEYLSLISIGYAFCYILFLIFPVAGQMNFIPDQYSKVLEGGIFTSLGESVRMNAHFPGGNLPSPHCMAATIMLFTLFRYNKKMFWLFLPVLTLLYISTVYCRFHYLWDAVIAVISAVILIKLYPVFGRIFCLFNLFVQNLKHPLCVSEALSDESDDWVSERNLI